MKLYQNNTQRRTFMVVCILRSWGKLRLITVTILELTGPIGDLTDPISLREGLVGRVLEVGGSGTRSPTRRVVQYHRGDEVGGHSLAAFLVVFFWTLKHWDKVNKHISYIQVFKVAE